MGKVEKFNEIQFKRTKFTQSYAKNIDSRYLAVERLKFRQCFLLMLSSSFLPGDSRIKPLFYSLFLVFDIVFLKQQPLNSGFAQAATMKQIISLN